ncbi:MAG TPA: hypothetical protein VLV87_06345 [Gammaproteobacteria bacterium]|nr:hypothetical protein [Gammaproteobacteria bacterium]
MKNHNSAAVKADDKKMAKDKADIKAEHKAIDQDVKANKRELKARNKDSKAAAKAGAAALVASTHGSSSLSQRSFCADSHAQIWANNR